MEEIENSLQERLRTDFRAFADAANSVSDEEFTRQTNGKWSVADVMQHLYLSARPVVRLMTGPREVLMQWGRPDAPSRSLEEIASTYQKVLATGAKAPANMSPRPEDMQVERGVLTERFQTVYEALNEAIDHWSAHELENYNMPHPAFGKLTVREMLYFVSAHTQHHLRLLPVA